MVIQSAANMGLVLDELFGLPPNIKLYNGGTQCDMMFGPCACGSWHNETDMYDENDIKRQYLYFLIVEKDNASKSRV